MTLIYTNTVISTDFRHTSQRTDKDHDELNARALTVLRSNTCSGRLLVREEASEQHHLTDADNKKDNGFTD